MANTRWKEAIIENEVKYDIHISVICTYNYTVNRKKIDFMKIYIISKAIKHTQETQKHWFYE